MEQVQNTSNLPSLETRVAAITLGVDGRIYCHDLTPELVDMLSNLCCAENALVVRMGAAREIRAVQPAEVASHE